MIRFAAVELNEWLRYELADGVATITMDDGKANVMSLAMQAALHRALDRAVDDGAAVLLTGRPGIFSGGFDLGTLQAGGSDAIEMVRGGFELSVRMLEFPSPIVVACTGHAVAMGAFLLLSADYRVGATGDYRITANEVAIGLTMPFAATEILRHRLTPAAFHRAVPLASSFAPDASVAAGFLDRTVEPDELLACAREMALLTSLLPRSTHAESKLRARQPALDAIRRGIAADHAAVAT